MTQTSNGNDIVLRVDVPLEKAIIDGPEKGLEVTYLRDIQCRTCAYYEKLSVMVKHCKACHNSKVESVRETQWLKTPPPHFDNHGMTIRYKGLGHYSAETGDTGRLIVTFNLVKDHDVVIEGSDIVNQLWVTPFQAKVGGDIPLKGVTMGMESAPLTPQHLRRGLRLRKGGKGGYRLNSKERGDLYFVVNIMGDDQHSPSSTEAKAVTRIEELEVELARAQRTIEERETQADIRVQELEGELAHAERMLKELKAQNVALEGDIMPKGATEEAWHAQGVKKLTGDLLPSIDSLEKALANMNAPSDQAHREGIAMILALQQKALAKHAIVKIDAKHQKFDPHQHEAVGMTDGSRHPKNVVTEVLMEGYSHAGRLLRPAMVKVSSGR